MQSLLGILTTAIAIQSVAPLPDRYNVRCQSEQAVGFNWENGRYIQANFRLRSYNIAVGDAITCRARIEERDEVEGMARFREVCVVLNVTDENPRPIMLARCTETTLLVDEPGITLDCRTDFGRSFVADIDGWFHMNSMHEDTSSRPSSGYKDSMVLEVGRCRRVP